MQYRTPCQLGDAETWFPIDEDGPGSAEARAGCARCPVRDECLALALRLGADAGIWGGLSSAQRREVRARQAA